jgi:hypothetical protein
MASATAERIENLAEQLMPEVVRACPAILHIRQAVWDADERLAPPERESRVDAATAPITAYWKGRRQSAIDLLRTTIGEVITGDEAVLPWQLRYPVVGRIIERLTSH